MNRRIFNPLILPAALIIVSTLIVWKWPDFLAKVGEIEELGALFQIFPFFPYVLLGIGIVLAWRFANAGMILTATVLGISYLGLMDSRVALSPVPQAAGLLLPLNMALFALLTRRRILSPVGISCLLLIGLQSLIVVLLFHPASGSLWPAAAGLKTPFSALLAALGSALIRIRAAFLGHALWGFKPLSALPILSFSAALVFLFLRFNIHRDAISAGFLGSLVAAFIGMEASRSGPSPMIYFSAAGLILIVTAIESSFFMAYIDELTDLPGRRSLNQTLVNLGKKYTIAMIDIDHFKQFNDMFGHKTGDQVLKMIATRLGQITGGAKVFRYGGEEFTAVFPGKSVEESLPHLEIYRKILESTPFSVRSKQRRKGSAEDRGKAKGAAQKYVKVTVSIGAAAPSRELTNPEKVLKAADKLLYKAKKSGRNRVVA